MPKNVLQNAVTYARNALLRGKERFHAHFCIGLGIQAPEIFIGKPIFEWIWLFKRSAVIYMRTNVTPFQAHAAIHLHGNRKAVSFLKFQQKLMFFRRLAHSKIPWICAVGKIKHILCKVKLHHAAMLARAFYRLPRQPRSIPFLLLRIKSKPVRRLFKHNVLYPFPFQSLIHLPRHRAALR